MAPPFFSPPVRAGFASTAEDSANTTVNLEEMLIRRPAATFLMKVSGDSLAGAGIHAGDTLIVDRSIEPRDGLLVVAVARGEMAVKRLPLPDGPEGFEVWGVVTYAIRQLA